MDIGHLLWHGQQQAEIEHLKDSALESKLAARAAAAEGWLTSEKRLAKFLLVSQAMWELIKSKTDLTDKDLAEMVTELDMKDGVADGRYTNPPVDCPKCGAKVCRKFNRCLFCGEEYHDGSAFDTV